MHDYKGIVVDLYKSQNKGRGTVVMGTDATSNDCAIGVLDLVDCSILEHLIDKTVSYVSIF